MKDIPKILLGSAQNTAIVTFIIAASSLFGWILTIDMIPQKIAGLIFSLTEK